MNQISTSVFNISPNISPNISHQYQTPNIGLVLLPLAGHFINFVNLLSGVHYVWCLTSLNGKE